MDFAQSLDLIEKADFQNSFVFKYSPRPGTAAAKLPGLDGMIAALINYTMVASDVWTTSTAIEKMTAAAS